MPRAGTLLGVPASSTRPLGAWFAPSTHLVLVFFGCRWWAAALLAPGGALLPSHFSNPMHLERVWGKLQDLRHGCRTLGVTLEPHPASACSKTSSGDAEPGPHPTLTWTFHGEQKVLAWRRHPTLCPTSSGHVPAPSQAAFNLGFHLCAFLHAGAALPTPF